MRERLNDLLIADHLIDECSLLTSCFSLQTEHAVGAARDELGHEQRQRCGYYYHNGYLPADGEHEYQRPHDGCNAGEQLRKSEQKSLGELVCVCDDAVYDIASGVSVDVTQR